MRERERERERVQALVVNQPAKPRFVSKKGNESDQLGSQNWTETTHIRRSRSHPPVSLAFQMAGRRSRYRRSSCSCHPQFSQIRFHGWTTHTDLMNYDFIRIENIKRVCLGPLIRFLVYVIEVYIYLYIRLIRKYISSHLRREHNNFNLAFWTWFAFEDNEKILNWSSFSGDSVRSIGVCVCGLCHRMHTDRWLPVRFMLGRLFAAFAVFYVLWCPWQVGVRFLWTFAILRTVYDYANKLFMYVLVVCSALVGFPFDCKAAQFSSRHWMSSMLFFFLLEDKRNK